MEDKVAIIEEVGSKVDKPIFNSLDSTKNFLFQN
jgi:hypothetical protein